MVHRCSVRGNPLVWADTSCNTSKKMHKHHSKCSNAVFTMHTKCLYTHQPLTNLGSEIKQQTHHSLNVVTTGVCATSEAHRAVAVEELLEERTAGKPHPAACIHTEVCIQQQFIKYLQQGEEKALRAFLHSTSWLEDPRCQFKWQVLSCEHSP